MRAHALLTAKRYLSQVQYLYFTSDINRLQKGANFGEGLQGRVMHECMSNARGLFKWMIMTDMVGCGWGLGARTGGTDAGGLCGWEARRGVTNADGAAQWLAHESVLDGERAGHGSRVGVSVGVGAGADGSIQNGTGCPRRTRNIGRAAD